MIKLLFLISLSLSPPKSPVTYKKYLKFSLSTCIPINTSMHAQYATDMEDKIILLFKAKALKSITGQTVSLLLP